MCLFQLLQWALVYIVLISLNSEALAVHIMLTDIFRCVLYKTDDGALSLDEFKAFFSDGILSNEDLEKLFHDIDTHNTK